MYAEPLPSVAPSTLPLHTARLTLRPYLPHDEPDFFRVLTEEGPRLQAAFPARVASVRTAPDAARVLTQFALDWRAGCLYVLGIWHRPTGHYLGDISLRPSQGMPASAEVGYYLAAEAEGHGYAREALAATVAFGFAELHAAHLTLRCRANNPRSRAVAEAVGFRPVVQRRRLWTLRSGPDDIIHYRLERPTA